MSFGYKIKSILTYLWSYFILFWLYFTLVYKFLYFIFWKIVFQISSLFKFFLLYIEQVHVFGHFLAKL